MRTALPAHPKVLAAFALLSACLLPASALADEQPSADLRGAYAPLHHEAGLVVEPTDSPDSGDITGAVRASYAFRPVTLRDQHDNLAYSVVEHQFTADIGLSVGIAGRVTLGIDLPLLLGQIGDDLSGDPEAQRYVGDQPIPLSSLGDPGLRAKVTIVKPERSAPGIYKGFGLALDERFTLPLADERSFLGEGAVASETRLWGEYGFGPVSGHLAAGAKLRADEGAYACNPDQPKSTCTSRFGHELPLVLGAALHPHELGVDPDARATLFVEVFGHLPLAPVAPTESVQPWALSGSLAARYTFGDLAAFAAVKTSFLDGVGSAPLTATIGVSFAPREKDADGDGVSDDKDRCPSWAEDKDGFEDTDGCPEMDNDGDGVPDPLDQCPDRKGDHDSKGC